MNLRRYLRSIGWRCLASLSIHHSRSFNKDPGKHPLKLTRCVHSLVWSRVNRLTRSVPIEIQISRGVTKLASVRWSPVSYLGVCMIFNVINIKYRSVNCYTNLRTMSEWAGGGQVSAVQNKNLCAKINYILYCILCSFRLSAHLCLLVNGDPESTGEISRRS